MLHDNSSNETGKSREIGPGQPRPVRVSADAAAGGCPHALKRQVGLVGEQVVVGVVVQHRDVVAFGDAGDEQIDRFDAVRDAGDGGELRLGLHCSVDGVAVEGEDGSASSSSASSAKSLPSRAE